jgi:heterodisulfide reductase subunit D
MGEIEKYGSSVNRCIRCGLCRSKYDYFEKVFRVCPSGEHSAGFWTNFPSGRVWTVKEILDGRLDITDAPIEAIYLCLLCGNCREKCGMTNLTTGKPMINVPHIVKALRADLFASGAELPEAVNMFSNAIEKTQNIFGAMIEERNDWLTDDIKLSKNANTIYFPGCLSTYREQEVAQTTAKVLNILGIKFNVLGEDEQCCGNPMLMVGNLFLARDLARHNYELLKDKKVIASCAGCYRTFIQEYPKLIGEECTVDATHIVKVLADLIEQGKVKFTKKIKQKVVYHDPCELGREMGVYDEPRKILQAIPGLEVVELERTRENTWCCGGGGGLKGVNFDMSVEIGGDKVEEALATGAKMIVSACPSCKTNINDAIRAVGADLKATDITELVAEALGDL